MPRKITLAVVWVVATMGSMLVVGSAIGIVRDQVVEKPADLPDVAALGLAEPTSVVPATTAATTDPGTSVPATSSPGTVATTPSAPATTSSPATTTTGAPAVSTSDPPDTSAAPPGSQRPTTTTTSTAAPTTTTTSAPTTTTTSGPVQFSTHQLVGGWVRIGSRPGEVFLDGAGAAPGFIVDIEESGPEKVSVEFSSDDHESEFQAEWRDGSLDIQIDEKPEGT